MLDAPRFRNLLTYGLGSLWHRNDSLNQCGDPRREWIDVKEVTNCFVPWVALKFLDDENEKNPPTWLNLSEICKTLRESGSMINKLMSNDVNVKLLTWSFFQLCSNEESLELRICLWAVIRKIRGFKNHSGLGYIT